MTYNFNAIEKKWQDYWAKNQTFKASNTSDKPKYYVLDMFPYPSGAGLHVGHPLGYIASDIYARYKRHKGFNVLHPQGYDSFGLPAEQYAIQTGQHPAITTEANIKTYRRQLDQIGFSFDWSREVRTSNPEYYKWTQWIFIQLFESWYNNDSNKAEHIDTLVEKFAAKGNATVNAACDENIESFTSEDWNNYSSEQQQDILLKYRLTYLAETEVNWCPALGTVLANDEIVNGVSERGGHSVVRKKMTQWSMRISAYAERLLQGLDTIDWTDALKDIQKNWIGKSVGASVTFNVIPAVSSSAVETSHKIDVFTTRPDTIFGVSFMTLAPEHELVSQITTAEQKEAVEAYIDKTAKRSERDRMADVKTISGVFTGAYAEHPFSKEPIPIWIGDYVLASYGTGAVMAVPCGDQRDYDFAKHFDIAIPNIFEGADISEEAYASKDNVKITNSDFLNGMNYKKASKLAIYQLEQLGQGEGKTNYRLRDAVFSRQRYWGEPFPVYYVNGMPQMIDKAHLPIVLPEVEKYLPTEEGEPPLGRADVWAWDVNQSSVVSNQLIDHKTVFPLELNTMPGWAGSSWYFFRYMEDAANRDGVFASEDALKYWENVDLYIGGSEHATGHLLYSRFWVKLLKDRGFVNVEEPFKKLINQGMILGTSAFFYSIKIEMELQVIEKDESGKIISETKIEPVKDYIIEFNLINSPGNTTQALVYKAIDEITNNFSSGSSDSNFEIKLLNYSDGLAHGKNVDVNLINPSTNELDINSFISDIRYKDYQDAVFITNNAGIYKVTREVEKMSKSKYNVVNPDQIVEDYGADSLRLYEMFLGPLEQYKPWNTAGITGVHNFLKKLWKLYVGDDGLKVNNAQPTADNLKTLHKTIKKVEEDIENFSFNTSVSTFMIAVNELTAQKCTSKDILEPLLILISPYAPHIAEELWSQLGNANSISTVQFPIFDGSHLVESSKKYPISFNGKMRFTLELPMDMSKDDIEKTVMAHEKTIAQLDGRTPKKVIVVPGKIVNIVG
ncbi:Leucyl-tRNA synthetase [Winogradskyella psychrotolerans RS-3]|uniref:Leucine--tRNA ligase n=1 Tax=Winogradskyella psychrotolerans RS-3 TaxID=641526 RepID=S7XB56_9FLAO|nr:class I tRNA ligase family protein [Winogradskyella psychrotolerans]EPR73218.1 Leucyl-tRNA synthetase [Winogradskyella psychrotolerans RS-3]